MPSLWCRPEQKECDDLEIQGWLAFDRCSEDQELLKNKEGTEPVWYASVGSQLQPQNNWTCQGEVYSLK